MNQAVKAIHEAESYPGRPLSLLTPPVSTTASRQAWAKPSAEQKAAVECGYWCNWRYDPRLLDAGKNPFHLDSREPKGDFRKFLLGEVRYASLQKLFPQEAEALFEKQKRCQGTQTELRPYAEVF